MVNPSAKPKPKSLVELELDKPFTYLKKLIYFNRCYSVVVPTCWHAELCKGKNKHVWMFVYKDRIIIKPVEHKRRKHEDR